MNKENGKRLVYFEWIKRTTNYCEKYKMIFYRVLFIHEHRGDGGGLKATPPLENFKKGPPPLKILPARLAKFFKANLGKILGKRAKFWAKTAKFQ
jgi:hypothetical protein